MKGDQPYCFKGQRRKIKLLVWTLSSVDTMYLLEGSQMGSVGNKARRSQQREHRLAFILVSFRLEEIPWSK